MRRRGVLCVLGAFLLSGPLGPGPRARAQDLPPLEPPALTPPDRSEPTAAEVPVGAEHAASRLDADRPPVARGDGPFHEASSPIRVAPMPTAIDRTPPAPIVERPGIDATSPDARWIEGYWDWDPARQDFVWVTGTWHVAPPGRFWVHGFWKRDDRGWSRVPGFWSERTTDRAGFRADGPPAVAREDDAGPAPGPDYFYIPGQYVPSGAGVAWRPGLWARSQPGWEWLPARWVRLSDGWAYREGRWVQAPVDSGPPVAATRDARTARASVIGPDDDPARATLDRHVVARPPLGGTGADPNSPTDLQPIPDETPGASPSSRALPGPAAVAVPPPGASGPGNTPNRPVERFMILPDGRRVRVATVPPPWGTDPSEPDPRKGPPRGQPGGRGPLRDVVRGLLGRGRR